jgi:lipopolysaccharide export system protein LptC
LPREAKITETPQTNPEVTNRRGCYLFLITLVLVALILGWLTSESQDEQQANEAISAPALR